LIRPTVWPQYTNVTDRQDKKGEGRQQNDSIGQTVLQTVAQKLYIMFQKTATLFFGNNFGK